MRENEIINWKKNKINLLEYFWSNTFLSVKNEKNLPFILQQTELFSDLSAIEIYELLNHMNLRNFSEGEYVFQADDYGMGFYIILSGSVDIITSKTKNEDSESFPQNITLFPTMYFGEKNLLLEKSKRNVFAKANSDCLLAAILKPDLDNLIDKKPRVAAKFIKILSRISLKRLDEIETNLFK